MKRGSQQTYEVLKKRIIAGHYTAGTQLKENHIAEDIGVSRTPVRAALKKLIEDGLAVAEEGRGVFIASWTRSEEHTSELQSLMSISYAVFCLKKKNNLLQEIT